MGKKKKFSFISLTSLLLCLVMVGWFMYSLSNTSVIHWGSGELWASKGRFVMTDKSIIDSPETKFFIRNIDSVQEANTSAFLSDVSVGYHSKPAPRGGGMMRNIVIPIWCFAILFAFAPFFALMKSKKGGKNDKQQGKPAGAH